jgi:ATP-dependent DNA ligase
VDEVPEGKDWQYEPKWDGFCRIIFAMGKKSKSGQSLSAISPNFLQLLLRSKLDNSFSIAKLLSRVVGHFFR